MFGIRTISKADTELLDQVERLWKEFYESMSSQGLMLSLVDEGEKKWRKSIESSLGRSMQLIVAIDQEKVIGFALGSLRIIPEYLGGHLTGFVNAIYIEPPYQQSGLGKALNLVLEEWFQSRKVHSVELQVLVGNEGGIEFWRSLGYEAELIQMRKRELS